jgi:protein TonB
MWQYAMNSPDNSIRFARGNEDARRTNRLLSLACFAVLALLHIAALSVFNFVETGEKSPAGIKELFFTLDFADQEYEEQSLPAAPLPREAVSSEIPEAVPVLAEETAAVSSAAESSTPENPGAESSLTYSENPAGFTAVSAAGQQVSSAPAPAGFARQDLRPDAINRYTAAIHGLIDRRKEYPYQARRQEQEGAVYIRFTLSRQGQLAGEPVLEKRSRYRLLNESALEAVKNAAPYPPFPAEITDTDMNFQVAVSFSLSGS